jgi:hypothetical protein
MAIVLALALIPSLVNANQLTAATISAKSQRGISPRPFEPKDVLIETPRQGKSKEL